MSQFADVTCILKVNVKCPACKMQLNEVLSSVIGVYSVEISASGYARVCGEVDPNMLLKAVNRTGAHAEVEVVKLNHPMLSQRQNPSWSTGGYPDPFVGHDYGFGNSYSYPGGGRARYNSSYGHGGYSGLYPEHSCFGGYGGGGGASYHGYGPYRPSYPMRRTMPFGMGGGYGGGGGYGRPFNGYGSAYMPPF
ncbi:OLC1v1007335C1 [Oldenlandia corymbosa var. corymbosa]|uniref:OLC1v1007335C1 n=1 Tax=Oldenlandia corymbosa var. corymbosa TaxID=529605 RepID=A0AAV1DJ24_OLDCO|nr:OLC1v1007335C1 [Oldenlandia corymbosa var. corymbosa]